jgi:hypothetical protein
MISEFAIKRGNADHKITNRTNAKASHQWKPLVVRLFVVGKISIQTGNNPVLASS